VKWLLALGRMWASVVMRWLLDLAWGWAAVESLLGWMAVAVEDAAWK
jgi:hypothetical protein